MTTETNTNDATNDTSRLTDEEVAAAVAVIDLLLMVRGVAELHREGLTDEAKRDLERMVAGLEAGGTDKYGERHELLLARSEYLLKTLNGDPREFFEAAVSFIDLVNVARKEILLLGDRFTGRGLMDLAEKLDDGASADIWYDACEYEGASSGSAVKIDQTTTAMTRTASLLRQIAALVEANKIVISPEGVISVLPDQKLLDAAERLVSEFHVYGEVLQFGEGDDYGSDTAVGELQLAVEAYGRTFPEPVPDADASDDDETPSPKG
jgi:hypothetical protein